MVELISRQINYAVSVHSDVVTIKVTMGDEYEARVFFDDISDRVKSGEHVTLKIRLRK